MIPEIGMPVFMPRGTITNLLVFPDYEPDCARCAFTLASWDATEIVLQAIVAKEGSAKHVSRIWDFIQAIFDIEGVTDVVMEGSRLWVNPGRLMTEEIFLDLHMVVCDAWNVIEVEPEIMDLIEEAVLEERTPEEWPDLLV